MSRERLLERHSGSVLCEMGLGNQVYQIHLFFIPKTARTRNSFLAQRWSKNGQKMSHKPALFQNMVHLTFKSEAKCVKTNPGKNAHFSPGLPGAKTVQNRCKIKVVWSHVGPATKHTPFSLTLFCTDVFSGTGIFLRGFLFLYKRLGQNQLTWAEGVPCTPPPRWLSEITGFLICNKPLSVASSQFIDQPWG